MTSSEWLRLLEDYQALLLQAVKRFSRVDYKKQYHPDLSPAGWHLGHCLFTENYWLREVILEREFDDTELKSLYIPELSPKIERGGSLPELNDLCDWTSSTQDENRRVLAELDDDAHPLLRANYFHNFLCQHYAQHYETVMYILTQQQIQKTPTFDVTEVLEKKAVNQVSSTVDASHYRIGNEAPYSPYDNEGPCFDTPLERFQIASCPVSNAEFLGFMQAGGYEEKIYWCEHGWAWRNQTKASHPGHWLQDTNHHWYGIDDKGSYSLAPDEPVHNINYYEAGAFAKWAGARLPHEYEWEAAQQVGLLNLTSKVWEWCANTFHPYTDFKAFPYDGYSLPYFDNRHYTLRGSSIHTQDVIKRASFRNYYQADKRHHYAGLRLVFD